MRTENINMKKLTYTIRAVNPTGAVLEVENEFTPAVFDADHLPRSAGRYWNQLNDWNRVAGLGKSGFFYTHYLTPIQLMVIQNYCKS